MEMKINIGFEQLLQLVKMLPASQLSKLKAELQNEKISVVNNNDLKAFLLQAPTFNSKQISAIAATRKSINQWRTK